MGEYDECSLCSGLEHTYFPSRKSPEYATIQYPAFLGVQYVSGFVEFIVVSGVFR